MRERERDRERERERETPMLLFFPMSVGTRKMLITSDEIGAPGGCPIVQKFFPAIIITLTITERLYDMCMVFLNFSKHILCTPGFIPIYEVIFWSSIGGRYCEMRFFI